MDSSDASNVYITGLDEATTYTFYGWTKMAESENSADSATTVQNIPDSPDISLNDVSFTSMTVHMETVYAADKNVTVSTFPGNRMTVPWIARMLPMYIITDWTKLQHTLAGHKYRRNQNSADASATTVQNSRCARYFAQRRVLHFHDCAHGDGLRRRQECYEFDVSWEPHDGAMDSSDARMSTSLD
jgi:hypothetical protein